MSVYYNDNDAAVCAWLRELIRRGLLPDGEVDNRSILDVEPHDLLGFTQCHFFAGIGGWAYAFRLAGIPKDANVWSGSPPCQPFSSAGKRLGEKDERHLAPHFADLVGACRPALLFGEQVASAAVFGKVAKRARVSVEGEAAPEWAWLDDLSVRLETARYAVGASDIPAASVGAPHIRQRTFFCAVDTERVDDPAGARHLAARQRAEGQARDEARLCGPERGCTPDRLADAEREQRDRWGSGETCIKPGQVERAERLRDADRLADAHDAGPQGRRLGGNGSDQRPSGAAGVDGGMADAAGVERKREPNVEPARLRGANVRPTRRRDGSGDLDTALGDTPEPRTPDSPWRDPDWLYCRDGKWRPVESGTFPLASRIPARVVRLRGYGNAIVPQAAQVFIESTLDALVDLRLSRASEMENDIFA